MAEQLMSSTTDGGGAKQLVARNCAMNTRPILIDNAVDAPLLRGAVLFAANQDAAMLPVAHGSLPASTDVVVILADDIDITDAAADVKACGFITGEFVEETVWAANNANLDA